MKSHGDGEKLCTRQEDITYKDTNAKETRVFSVVQQRQNLVCVQGMARKETIKSIICSAVGLSWPTGRE